MTSMLSRCIAARFKYFGISTGLLVLAHFVQIPITGQISLDLTWITALVTATLFRNRSALYGIGIGYILGGLLHQNPSFACNLSETGFLRETLTAFCIFFSALLVQKKITLTVSRYWIGMILTLLALGGWTFYLSQSKISGVFYAASFITGCLSCSKNASLLFYPSTYFMSWLSGYSLWIIGISVMNLDPFIPIGSKDFLHQYVLIPFPVYILEILIGSHIAHAIIIGRSTTSS